jgi:uncharacterized protein
LKTGYLWLHAGGVIILPYTISQLIQLLFCLISLVANHPSRKKDPASYRHRCYRQLLDSGGLVPFEVKIRETDLHILATEDRREQALQLVLQLRNQLEAYIAGHPEFLTSLRPLPMDPLAPSVAKAMAAGAAAAGVGPMAAVAGAIAEFVGRGLLAAGIGEIMVENGGDIFLKRDRECLISVFAGASPLSHKVGIQIPRQQLPLGICTSSGTVGHSFSFGQADAVTVLAASVPLADAAATRLGNEIKMEGDIEGALALARTIPGVLGVLVVKGRHLGAWGDLHLISLD